MIWSKRILSGLTAAVVLLGPAHVLAMDLAEVRSFIAAGDVEGMEAAFDVLDQEVQSRQVEIDAQIDAYRVFQSTNPQVEPFVTEWLNAHPNSVHPHVARTYWLMGSAVRIRGSRTPRYTYPEALHQFRRLTDLARNHAVTAYELDPRNAGAGKQVLYVGIVAALPRPYESYLREIMEDSPYYTLFRQALYSTKPGWGGTWDQASEMCDAYALKIKDVKGYTVEVCKVDAAFLADHHDPRGTPPPEVFETSKSPALEKWRSRYAFFLGPENKEGRQRAIQAAENGDINDLDLALEFDRYFPGRDSMFDIIYERKWDEAKRGIEHDPYNIDYIDVLRMEWNGRGLLPNRPDHDELVALLKRSLVSGPYDGFRWTELADLVARRPDANNPEEVDPYYINGIVYSNYFPGALLSYQFHREALYLHNNPGHLATIRKRGDLVVADPNTGLGQMSSEDLLCPLIRITRLREALCQEIGDEGYCQTGSKNTQIYQGVTSKAAVQGICENELNATLDELAYAPVPQDFRISDKTQ